MTLDDVKNLRDMFTNHMELPADQMAELFDIAEAAASVEATPVVAKTRTKAQAAPVEVPAEPVADVPVAAPDTVVAQG